MVVAKITSHEEDAMPEIKAVAPSSDNADTALPDPTPLARWTAFALVGIALALAAVMNAFGWTAKAFRLGCRSRTQGTTSSRASLSRPGQSRYMTSSA